MSQQQMGLPPQFQQMLEAAQRKQQMAQALMQRSMGFQGAQSQGRIASKTPALAWLANLGTTGLAARNEGLAAEGITKARSGAMEAEQSELARLQKLPQDQFIAEAQRSQFPSIRKLAETQKAQLDKSFQTILGTAATRSPDIAVGMARSGQLPQAGEIPEEGMTVNGQVIPKYGSIGADKRDKYNAPERIGGDLYQLVPETGKYSKLDNAPRTTIDMGGTAENAAMKALGGKYPEIAESTMMRGTQAAKGLDDASRILQLSSDPETITGFMAEPARFLASMSAKFGFTGPEAVAKTQALLSTIAEQTLDASMDLKGAITEKEWPRLAQARAGEISYTPEALQQLAHIQRARSYNEYLQAARQRNNLLNTPGGKENLAVYPMPGMGGEFAFPPELYQEMKDGTIRYIGSIDAIVGGGGAAAGGQPAKAAPKTPENPYAGFKVVR